jgi:ribonuclease Z
VVDVIVLGSGTPNPDPDRAGAAVAVIGRSSWVMVDCGRAATQRALSAGLDPTTVAAVLITHHHSDHLSDLATFAIVRWVAGATSPLKVVVPEGPAAAFTRGCLEAFDDQTFHGQAAASAGRRPAISSIAFDASSDMATVLRTDDWAVSSVLVDHHPVEPAVGYLVESSGIRVAISGDTAVCDGMRRLAHGVHVLVHEAVLSARVSPSLLEWNASARSVGELAALTRPETLVLTHMIPAPACAEDELAYLEEVREGGFTGRTLVAHDLLRLAAGG